jgi:hypothetical protein
VIGAQRAVAQLLRSLLTENSDLFSFVPQCIVMCSDISNTWCMERKNPAPVEPVRLGDKATAQKLNPEERREKVRRVVQTRWAKQRDWQITEGAENC